MSLLISKYYKKFIKQSNEHIIIDCGHTAITMSNGKILFGKKLTGPSPSEINTVKLAIEISKHLLSLGKKIIIHFSFSDTGCRINPEIRKNIKNHFLKNDLLDIIDIKYKEIINPIINDVSLSFNFQSTNSNIASSSIKKIKKQLSILTEDQAVDRYGSLFLSRDTSTFGILSPLVFNYHPEEKNDGHYFNSLSNSHVAVNDNDILKFPLINLKKSCFIGLHDKFDGILCPGTYMGNIFNMPSKVNNIISIYSRSDDAHIGEKILAGAIAHYHFSQYSNYFLSIIFQNGNDNKEIFLIEKDVFNYERQCFLKEISLFLSDKKNFEVYK